TIVLRRPDAGPNLADGDLSSLPFQFPGSLGRLGRSADADAVLARWGATPFPGKHLIKRLAAETSCWELWLMSARMMSPVSFSETSAQGVERESLSHSIARKGPVRAGGEATAGDRNG